MMGLDRTGGAWKNRRRLAALIGAALILSAFETRAADRHAGYYYPAPEKVETYQARTRTLPGMTVKKRVAFVTAMSQQILERPYAPHVSLFAKGENKEKLIIVSNTPGRLDTIYRVRAYLATLTSSARLTPIFRELGMEETLTFFDLLKMLGFERITISDGAAFTHQVRFE